MTTLIYETASGFYVHKLEVPRADSIFPGRHSDVMLSCGVGGWAEM